MIENNMEIEDCIPVLWYLYIFTNEKECCLDFM